MIPGGISDKIGNTYEADWTILEALYVLRGSADAIRIEPFDEGADGFEFWVNANGLREWHQCKSRRSTGTWTMATLAREGILAAFAEKLTAPDARCVFISSDVVAPFKTLTGKAKLTEDHRAFGSKLSDDELKGLATLREVWRIAPEVEHDWLRRCRVEIISDESLRRQIEALCSITLRDEPGSAIGVLKAHLEAHLTHTLTTDTLREAATHELGLHLRAELDPSVDAVMAEATDSYLSTLRTTIGGIKITTPAEGDALAAIQSRDTKNIVVAGTAGSGKSSVIAAIVDVARNAGLQVLAFRIDRLLACKTVEEVGAVVLGRDDNPVAVLGNRSGGKPCVVIIDQVDAVSEASGRSALARDLFFKLVRTANLFPDMKVVIACRTFDLANDYNLKQLSEAEQSKTLKLVALDWTTVVAPTLEKLGIEVAGFTESAKKILALPLNLHLFVEVALSGEPMPPDLSTGRLFDALLKTRAREILDDGFTWTPIEPLGAMSDYMSLNQELVAPEAVLATVPGATTALESAGLISCQNGRVQFAHESFFDYVFAARFLAQGKKVVDLLRSDEQRLFRRTQVRQIFAKLRDQGVNRRYLQELTSVIGAPEVRYLVKDALGSWLAAVETPTKEELNLVLSWMSPAHPLSAISRTIIHGRSWFGVLADGGTITSWLSGSEEDQNLAMWLLRQNATASSDRIEAILRHRWENNPERTIELLKWFGELYVEGDVGVLEKLYAELVAAAPQEVFDDGNLPQIMGLSTWTHGDPARGARVLSMWLRRWFELFDEGHPFERIQHNDDGSYWVKEAADKVPGAFADAILPSFAEAIRREHIALEKGAIRYSELTNLQPDDDEDTLPPRNYTVLVRNALKAVAAEDPVHAKRLLELLPPEAKLSLHLKLETIAANQALAASLPPLLASPFLLEAGYHWALWSSFSDAAHSAMPGLSEGDRLTVERLALSHRPELDYVLTRLRREQGDGPPTAGDRLTTLHYLSQAGCEERAILTTIGREFLSDAASRRLDELDRKFRGEPLPKRYNGGGGFVRSPIDSDAAARMTDDQWLKAMARYKNDDNHVYHRRHVIGGCRELASVLRAETTKNPGRFVNLLARLPRTANAAYPEAILGGLHNSGAPPELVEPAIEIGLTWPRPEFDRTICWAVQECPQVGANPRILAFLLDVAANGSASDTAVRTTSPKGREERTQTIRELLGGEMDIESSGINGDRGSAYQALGAVLWEHEATLSEIRQLLDQQIEIEPLASVRTCMVRIINSISRYDPERGIGLFMRLAARDLGATCARNSSHFLRWAVYNYPDVLMPLLSSSIASDVEPIRAQGLFYLSGVALSDPGAEARLLALAETDLLARRVLAFRGSGNVEAEGFGERAEKWVTPLLSDPEKDVRDEAAHCHWDKLLDGSQDHTAFVGAYIASPTFAHHADGLMRALSEKTDVYPELTMQAVRRVISLLDEWQKDRQRGHFSVLHRLGKTLVNLYRAMENDPVKEAEILDLFDDYLARDLQDLRQEISAYERH